MSTPDLGLSSPRKDEAHDSNERALNERRSTPADAERDPNKASVELTVASDPLSLECELTPSSKWRWRHNGSGGTGSPAGVLHVACALAEKAGALVRRRPLHLMIALALYGAYFTTAIGIAIYRTANEPHFCLWNDEPTIRLISMLLIFNTTGE